MAVGDDLMAICCCYLPGFPHHAKSLLKRNNEKCLRYVPPENEMKDFKFTVSEVGRLS